MNEQTRLEEYRRKARILFEEYRNKDKELSKRRRNYTMLDQGVKEERKLQKEYKQAQKELDNEYGVGGI
jgi:hypothetical protein